ncbi:MAG: hypothetical protein CMK89_09805 [Pseudomonadales bacterium]|nr:hypothetical protein [Pseudomonadales bacterium]
MNPVRILIAGLLALIQCSVYAAGQSALQPQQVYLHLGYDWVDVDDADFDGAFSAEGGLRWAFSDNVLLEAGVSGINDSETDTLEDNTGSYQLTLNSWDFLLGGHYQFDFTDKSYGFVRLGLLFYSMEIELEEGFYGLKPSGKDSTSDNGFGFYAGGGCAIVMSPNMTLEAQVIFKRRPDFLDGSSRPFDVDTTTISIGTRYSF